MTRASDELPDQLAGAARWFYRGVWRALIDWFRVPAEPPDLPAAPGDAPTAFRPDPGLLDYFRFWFWFVAVLAGLAVSILWIVIMATLPWVGVLVLPLALLVVVVPGLIGYVGLHLRFDTTWYVMTRRSLRIRRGIWIIHEMTITFENVQNVKVEQGPLQRYFNVGSLVIETAGGGGDKSKQGLAIANRALIEGIADTTGLRDRILAQLRSSRATGLGDEQPASRGGWRAVHIAALREIRDATGALARPPS